MWNVYLIVLITINWFLEKMKKKTISIMLIHQSWLGKTIFYFIDCHRLNNSKLEFLFKWRNVERYFGICVFFKVFFPNTIFTRRFSILSPSICVPFFFNWIWIQFKFHYNVVHASISPKNESMFLVSKTFGIFPCFVRILVFLDDFNLGTNKEKLLHVSLLNFGQNSYILRLF